MATKKKARRQSVVRSKVTLKGMKEPRSIKEGYGTVKNRLYNGQQFIDLTLFSGRKITINKGIIELVYPAD